MIGTYPWEMWGDAGRCGEMWGDCSALVARRLADAYVKMYASLRAGDMGRYGKIWGDMGRYGQPTPASGREDGVLQSIQSAV